MDITSGKAKLTIREAIIRSVEIHPGINAVELCLKVMGLVNPLGFDESFDGAYEIILEELAEDKEVVELVYTLPFYRNKILYFPKGTVLTLEYTR